jgi:hypothetical protein
LVTAAILAGRGEAQVQGLPVEPPAAAAAVSTPAPRGVGSLPPVAVPASDPFPVSVTDPTALWGPPPACAVPGVPDVCPPGPPPCADPFRWTSARGSVVSGFPRTLLWEPPLAGLREPRFMLMPTTYSSDVTDQTVDTAVGNTLGLLRYEPAGSPTAWQFDVFAVVYSRFSEYDFFVTADYRLGLPISWACGPWHGKFGYEHTSTHLGDEILVRTGRAPFDYIKDEFVLALGRYWFDQRLRVYGQAAWAFSQEIPGDPSPWRFDLGAEWVRRRATGCWGQPFAAGNLEFNGAVDYSPSFSLQGGWMWRDPARRLGQARVFAQYFTGHSLYGQFFQTRENWFGLGVALDY